MRSQSEETEVKFCVLHPSALADRILSAGGRLITPRIHELNLRFDTPRADLGRAWRVLRLRRDQRSRLTYKDRGIIQDGVVHRTEIELEVGDFAAARELLTALGYVEVFAYEKIRSTYALDGVEIMLDELPFGDFAEIEGSPDRLHSAAATLHLKWSAAIPYGYHELFGRLALAMHLTITDLTFENFSGIRVTPQDLGVSPADV